MTEKRFKLAYKEDDWWAVRDSKITLWKEEVIHLLNELHEENKRLKQENKQLKKENTELKSSIDKLYNKHIDEFFEYYDPTNENDKLKSELEEIYYTQVYEPVEPYDEEIHKMCRILYEAFNEGKNE